MNNDDPFPTDLEERIKKYLRQNKETPGRKGRQKTSHFY